MGDINQVYNDDKAIQTIAFQSIFESKLLELKTQMNKKDLVQSIIEIRSILSLCKSGDKIKILESNLSIDDRMRLIETILVLIFDNKMNVKKKISSDDISEIRQQYVDYHNVLLRFLCLGRTNLQDYLPMYLIHFSSLSFSLDCYLQEMKVLNTSGDVIKIELISNRIIKLLNNHRDSIPNNYVSQDLGFFDEILTHIYEQISLIRHKITLRTNSLSVFVCALIIVPVLILFFFNSEINSFRQFSGLSSTITIVVLAVIILTGIISNGTQLNKLQRIKNQITFSKVTNAGIP
jgi:hypothetical protein